MSAQPRPITAIAEKYRVIARVGRGGTADINLAVATGPGGFNKLVVLKSLREEYRGSEDYLQMFMVEARLNAQLSHPHIVQTNEVFEFDGLPVIVMEYLEGQSLGNVARRARKLGPEAPFDQSMHLRVLSDMLHALDYAHNKQGLDGKPLALVHCDVTPQNIFLSYAGEVKLVDFGIAKQICEQTGTATGDIRGKIRYMPPEQIVGEGVDQRTDIYAVGAMAWEAAAGMRLWLGCSADQIEQAVLAGEIPVPSSVTPDVDPELERLVMRALEPDKEKRYQTALEMQMDLDRFLGISGTQLRSRDIGNAVSAMFEAECIETRAVVAEQLAQLAALPEGGSEQLRLVDLPGTFVPKDLSLPPEAPRRRRVVVPLLVAVVAVGLAVGMALRLALRAPPEITPAAVSSTVQLRITAFPERAAISLDGVSLGENPTSRDLPRSSEPHEIRVAASGYEPSIRTVTLQEPLDIVIALTPHAAAPEELPQPSARPRPRRRPVVAPPHYSGAGKSAPEPNCDPPSYFDEKGIKHFKPECL